jgi:GT2 family glycosyltransferase
MRTTVSAIVVAEPGGIWLEDTLEALSQQSRTPDRLIVVVNGTDDKLVAELARSGADAVVSTGSRVPFGAAVARAEVALEEPGEDTDEELLWLLTEDSAPEPRALHYLYRQLAGAPSVAIAGPKLIDWDRTDRIVELGQSLTRYGSRWLLRRQELDQQQYDHLQDVMGVGPTGMLVRRSVWQDLEGFDPALPVWDDALDFSVRARLAGHRVVVAPKARIRAAQTGIAGPHIDRRRKIMRQSHRRARTSQLHRRLSYAPALLAPLYWIALPVVAVLRVFWALLREQPGYMVGEFVAALTVFFTPARVIRARGRIRRNNIAGWGAVRPLRIDPKSVRTARIIDREAILNAQGRRRRELHFISTGGLIVLLISVVFSLALGWWLYTENTLSGGSMIPLSDIGDLWANTRMIDGVPADPFVWILALLGTITFFNPSLGLVAFLAASIPLAALGGWLWGAQFAQRASGRALAGFAWALSPVLLGSIDHGRFPTVVLAVVLPWMLIAATRAHESWSWAGIASLLAAFGLAAAPVLIPIALILWVVGMFVHPRHVARIASTAIASAVLFLPKIFYVLSTGRLLEIFSDPGVTGPYEPGTLWHMLLGFPQFGLEGWGQVLENIGLGEAPATLLVGVLFVPLALLALLGLFTGKVTVSVFSALLGGLGMITAIVSAQISLTTQGTEQVPLWTGSGLALYWIAIVTLAASGTDVLGRGGTPLAALAVIASLVGIGPLAVHLMLGQSEVRESSSGMPSIVQAAGAQDEKLRTLVVEAAGPNAVHTEIVQGSGRHLDDIRTSSYTPRVTNDEKAVAELAGSLASVGATDLDDQLQRTGVGFVLLRPDGDSAERSQLQAIFDDHGTLHGTGATAAGQLWRVDKPSEKATPEASDDDSHTVFSVAALRVTAHTSWWIQIVVLLGMTLLALPTGEVVERPERQSGKKRKKGSEGRTIASPAAVDLVGDEGAAAAAPEDPMPDHTDNSPSTDSDAAEMSESENSDWDPADADADAWSTSEESAADEDAARDGSEQHDEADDNRFDSDSGSDHTSEGGERE